MEFCDFRLGKKIRGFFISVFIFRKKLQTTVFNFESINLFSKTRIKKNRWTTTTQNIGIKNQNRNFWIYLKTLKPDFRSDWQGTGMGMGQPNNNNNNLCSIDTISLTSSLISPTLLSSHSLYENSYTSNAERL